MRFEILFNSHEVNDQFPLPNFASLWFHISGPAFPDQLFDLKGDLPAFSNLIYGVEELPPATANLSNSQMFFNDFAQYYLVPTPNRKRAFGITFKDYAAIQNGVVPLPDQYHVGDFTKPPDNNSR